MVLRHLALKGLVLGAFAGSPRTFGRPIGGWDELGVAEQEQLVRGGRHSGVRIGSVDVVRQLLDGLDLGLEIGRHEVPEITGVETAAELRLLPATVC